MINKQPQITFVYDRRKTASPTKMAAVEMRISYNYKQKYISTGIMLYPNQWRKGRITNRSDIHQISQTLDRLLANTRQVLLDMLNEGHVDISAIPDRLHRLQTVNMSFMEFCKMRASVRKYGKAEDSQERYDRFIRLFEEWGEIREFSDISDSNIISYDRYLIKRGLKNYSKWNNYHRFLNSFITDAMDEGLLHRNPYKWINIDKSKTSDGIERCLTPQEFYKLKSTAMPTESLTRVQDLFIFQTYTCMSYSDLCTFNPSRIQEIKNMKVYTGNRKKTGIPYTIPIVLPAMSILDKYKLKLPIISNVKYNEYLKIVAQASGIDKPVSSHWARHTGATLLLNEGIDIHIVSKICGHSSIKITERIYAKLLDETIVTAVQEKEKPLSSSQT